MINLFSTSIVMAAILTVGIYLTFKLKLVQVRDFNRGWKKMFRSNQTDTGLSSFSAAALAMGGRIGTANIAGVAFIIFLCGYGVIFWLWVAAFFGMAISFVETTLAQIYKEYDEDGTYLSGPMVYIERGLDAKYRVLGKIYGLLLTFTVGFMYLIIHTSMITQSIMAFSGVTQNLKLEIFIATFITIIAAYILFGGTKKVASILAYIVPVMMIAYIWLVIMIAFTHIGFVPEFFKLVLAGAFNPQGVLGGSILTMIVVATALSTLSNEAGLGTSTFAGGLANGSHPAQQGFANMITIFIDVLICTLTAFVIILALESGSIYVDVANTSELAMQSFADAYHGGSVLLLLFILVFTFTTIIASITYGTQVIKLLMLNHSYKAYKMVLNSYLGLVLILILVTPYFQISNSILTGMVGLATIVLLSVNMFTIFKLRHVAFDTYDHYHHVGHEFKAKDINVDYKDQIDDIWI